MITMQQLKNGASKRFSRAKSRDLKQDQQAYRAEKIPPVEGPPLTVRQGEQKITTLPAGEYTGEIPVAFDLRVLHKSCCVTWDARRLIVTLPKEITCKLNPGMPYRYELVALYNHGAEERVLVGDVIVQEPYGDEGPCFFRPGRLADLFELE